MQPIPTAEQAVRTDDIATIFDFHRAGEFNAARRRCQRALRHGSSDARLPYLMACLEIHADNPEGASQWFFDAIATEAAVGSHRNPIAADIPPAFAETLACDPRPELVCHKLGSVACARRKMLAACLALKAWLTHAPGEVTALLRLGDVAGQLENHALASACLEKALRLDPDNAAIALRLGNARNRKGELHGALDAYQRAARLNGDAVAPQLNIALTLQKLGRMTEAEEILRGIIADRPGHTVTLFKLATLLLDIGQLDEAARLYENVVTQDPHHAAAWLNQGHAYKRIGLVKKAVHAYERAALLEPDNPQAHFLLGATLHGLKDFAGAEAALAQAASLQPGDQSSAYLLKALRHEAVSRAPRDYIEALFDRYAVSFDRHMRGLLQYRIPALLRKQLKPVVKKYGRFSRLLDIGCGTGLAGAVLKDFADHMIGVDLSRNILAQAAQKNIYNCLIHDDFQQLLETTPDCFDLVVAADVFIYTGNLNPAFALIRKRLTANGHLVFSTEKTDEADFLLQASGRFSHSRGYITALAQRHGFRQALVRSVPVRMEDGAWIYGDLFMLVAESNQAM
jgi:predicted TPR repeat methyltransferase